MDLRYLKLQKFYMFIFLYIFFLSDRRSRQFFTSWIRIQKCHGSETKIGKLFRVGQFKKKNAKKAGAWVARQKEKLAFLAGLSS